MKYYINPFLKAFDFNGKSTIKQFWVFILFQYLIFFIIGLIEGQVGIKYVGKVYLFVTLVPFIALGFRRLNDSGFNRWLFLIPIANIILASIPKKG